ncbi:MAG: ABC transporter permease, partial [bacterium]
MGYELFVGKRYLLSPRSDRSISMITWISIGGVALGVIALIVSTSVMNGFRSNLRDAVTGSLPHITLFSWDEEIGAYNSLKKKVLEHPEVVAASPYVYKQALITGKKKPKGALLRGIDPQQEPSVTRISSYLRESIYSLGPLEEEEQRRLADSILGRLSHPKARAEKISDGIILGASLAQQLDVRIGDTVKVI